MSLLKAIKQQLGLSNTPANNFTLDASADDGTMKLARGNAGATTQDIMTVDTLGNVTFPQGVLTLRAAVATTSGTTVDFTSIPSWVKRIVVTLVGVSLSGGSLVLVQLGTSAGFVTTGYLGSNGFVNTAGTTSMGNLTQGLGTGGAASSSDVRHGAITITRQSALVWASVASIGLSNVASIGLASSSITLPGTLDRLRLASLNGTDTFDAGSVSILYEG